MNFFAIAFFFASSPLVLDNQVVDSFIRDDVQPKDFRLLTENSKRGRTHLAGCGSGFFVTKKGYVLTNHHVVENAAEVVVVHHDIAYRAFVVARSKKNDLALLKINIFPRGTNGVYVIEKLPEVSCLAFSSEPQIGQAVYALGFPRPDVLGYEPKVTKGIVCSLTGFRGEKNEFQMDASITHGNSGGPVVDEYGHVIGVTVAHAHRASEAANYAVKAEIVRKFIPSDINVEYGAPGRIHRSEKMLGKAIDSLVLILNYKEGACERMIKTATEKYDVHKRENDTAIRKAMLDAKLFKIRKDWKALKEITEWIINVRGDVGDIRELNNIARDELGLHLIVIAEADGLDVPAKITPLCGFKENYVNCGKEVCLYGGSAKRGFPVEAKLEYEDGKWRWRGELSCYYDWHGTKEIRVVMKKIGIVK